MNSFIAVAAVLLVFGGCQAQEESDKNVCSATEKNLGVSDVCIGAGPSSGCERACINKHSVAKHVRGVCKEMLGSVLRSVFNLRIYDCYCCHHLVAPTTTTTTMSEKSEELVLPPTVIVPKPDTAAKSYSDLKQALGDSVQTSDFVGNDACSGDKPLSSPKEVNCDFEEKSKVGACAWRTKEKMPVGQWKLIGGQVDPVTFQEVFGTDVLPKGKFLALNTPPEVTEEDQFELFSCPIECSDDTIKLSFRHWMTGGDLFICFRDFVEILGKFSDTCVPVKKGGEAGQPTVEVLPPAKQFTVYIRAEKLQPGHVLLLDDILLDFKPCGVVKEAAPIPDEFSLPLITTTKKSTSQVPKLPVEPVLTTTAEAPSTPAGPMCDPSRNVLTQCARYCLGLHGPRFGGAECPKERRCICHDTVSVVALTGDPKRRPCNGHAGLARCRRHCQTSFGRGRTLARCVPKPSDPADLQCRCDRRQRQRQRPPTDEKTTTLRKPIPCSGPDGLLICAEGCAQMLGFRFNRANCEMRDKRVGYECRCTPKPCYRPDAAALCEAQCLERLGSRFGSASCAPTRNDEGNAELRCRCLPKSGPCVGRRGRELCVGHCTRQLGRDAVGECTGSVLSATQKCSCKRKEAPLTVPPEYYDEQTTATDDPQVYIDELETTTTLAITTTESVRDVFHRTRACIGILGLRHCSKVCFKRHGRNLRRAYCRPTNANHGFECACVEGFRRRQSSVATPLVVTRLRRPTTPTTVITEPPSPLCELLKCDFEDGSYCGWESVGKTTPEFDLYRRLIVLYGSSRLRAESGRRYAGAALPAGHKAGLMVRGLDLEGAAWVLRARIYNLGANVSYTVCWDDTDAESCAQIANPDVGVEGGQLSGRWQAVHIDIPADVNELYLLASNDGATTMRIGFDNFELLRESDNSQERTGPNACS